MLSAFNSIGTLLPHTSEMEVSDMATVDALMRIVVFSTRNGGRDGREELSVNLVGGKACDDDDGDVIRQIITREEDI